MPTPHRAYHPTVGPPGCFVKNGTLMNKGPINSDTNNILPFVDSFTRLLTFDGDGILQP